MQDENHVTVLPAGTECITRPASSTEMLQIAFRHPTSGWIAVEVNRQKAFKLALELQAFADFRSTADEDA